MPQRLTFSPYVHHCRYHGLDNHFAAPEAWKLGCVQSAARSRRYSCFDDAAVFGMNAIATQDNGVDLGAIIADSAPSVIAVNGVDRGAVVACRQDPLVFDDDRAHCLLNTARPDLENFADGNEIFIEIRSKLSKNLFIIF